MHVRWAIQPQPAATSGSCAPMQTCARLTEYPEIPSCSLVPEHSPQPICALRYCMTFDLNLRLGHRYHVDGLLGNIPSNAEGVVIHLRLHALNNGQNDINGRWWWLVCDVDSCGRQAKEPSYKGGYIQRLGKVEPCELPSRPTLTLPPSLTMLRPPPPRFDYPRPQPPTTEPTTITACRIPASHWLAIMLAL